MADEVYYHVTRTANLPKIAERGIVGMQPTNFVNPSGQRLGELGKIYAFSDYKDAVQFASEMDWQAHGDLGTGKVSIIAHKPGAPGGNPWETDPDTQLFQKSGLRAQRRVPIEDILGAEPVDMSLIKNLSEGGGSIDPPTTRLQPLIKGVAMPDEKDFSPEGTRKARERAAREASEMEAIYGPKSTFPEIELRESSADKAAQQYDYTKKASRRALIDAEQQLKHAYDSDSAAALGRAYRHLDEAAKWQRYPDDVHELRVMADDLLSQISKEEWDQIEATYYSGERGRAKDAAEALLDASLLHGASAPDGHKVGARFAGKALKFGKAGLKAIPLAGLAAEFADIPTAEASTIAEEFRTREEVLEAEKAAEESAAFLAEQPGYEPEGTPPAWADPEWEKQRRFGDEPEEEADYSPEGTRKSRDAAAKKAMEK